MNTAKYSFALTISGVLCFAAVPRSFAQSASLQAATPLAASAPTAVPALVPYSGVAVAADGKPLSGEASVTFLIYKDESGGEPLFTESQTVALDASGRYKTQLGATLPNGIPLGFFTTGEARWLDVQVAGQPSQPRVLLVSVPYALKAGDASTLGGLPASAYAVAGTKTATAALNPAISSDTVSNVTTSGGTSGYLPVFTGASTVVDSILYSSSTGIGVGDVPNSTAVFDVNGKSIWRGLLDVARAGNATTTSGFDSYPILLQGSVYNSATKSALMPVFQLQVEPADNNTATPSASFNLLYNSNSGTPTETGLSFNSNGTINFAPGQTFKGAGAGTITGVTAGTALSGGGTTGTVTLNIDTTKVPLLAASNQFTGNQAVTGTVSASGNISSTRQLISSIATGTAPFAVSSTTVVPNLNAGLLGGYPSSAYAGLGALNNFTATQTFSKIGVGTSTPRSLVEVQASASAGLGPVFTLTNKSGGKGAESALDFNTILPSTAGTYNPMSRIAAADNNGYSDNLLFQSNTPGAPNNGLETNMFIQSNGQVGINTVAPAAQLEVDANPTLGTDAIYGFGATTGSGAGTIGVRGTGGAASGSIGVQGFGGSSIAANSAGSGGIFTGGFAEGTGSGGDGVDAYAGGSEDTTAPAGYAGYFSGNVNITGTSTTGASAVEIDHPLDPANKYLVHASVESSEMVNIYSGNVVTDKLGIATVTLPDWFESVNTDFRYQLTVIGKFAQAIVSEEIGNHQFKISTNASFTKVSWQVTGVRHDAYAVVHPLVVERDKSSAERGYYAHPELYGQPAEKQTQWARRPEAMRRMKALQAQRNAPKTVAP